MLDEIDCVDPVTVFPRASVTAMVADHADPSFAGVIRAVNCPSLMEQDVTAAGDGADTVKLPQSSDFPIASMEYV